MNVKYLVDKNDTSRCLGTGQIGCAWDNSRIQEWLPI